jgi:hypothetical protein
MSLIKSALAPPIVATTLVAKVLAAIASHVVAPMRLLNPNLALRALLELTPLYKRQKLGVINVHLL